MKTKEILPWLFDLEPNIMKALELIGLALASYALIYIPNLPNKFAFIIAAGLFSLLAFMQIILAIITVWNKLKKLLKWK